MKLLPNHYFYIIGNGSYKTELERIIDRLSLGNVKVFTDVSDEEKYRWLKTCSLFVNLSGVEAFGMSVLEALAAGKPAIVSEEGGLKELSNLDGVFPLPVSAFEKRIDELAKAISEKFEVGETPNVDLSEYDWSNVVKSIMHVYTGKR